MSSPRSEINRVQEHLTPAERKRISAAAGRIEKAEKAADKAAQKALDRLAKRKARIDAMVEKANKHHAERVAKLRSR